MEVETLPVVAEDTQHAMGQNEAKEAAQLATFTAQDAAAKAKEAKPAAERKRTRNLSEDKRFKLFSGTANRALTEEIGRHIGVPVGEVKLQRFADGEVYFQLL
jgi:ribose-phosphate pyrophosphokinase